MVIIIKICKMKKLIKIIKFARLLKMNENKNITSRDIVYTAIQTIHSGSALKSFVQFAHVCIYKKSSRRCTHVHIYRNRNIFIQFNAFIINELYIGLIVTMSNFCVKVIPYELFLLISFRSI